MTLFRLRNTGNVVEDIARDLFQSWGAKDMEWDELPGYRKDIYRDWVREYVLPRVLGSGWR